MYAITFLSVVGGLSRSWFKNMIKYTVQINANKMMLKHLTLFAVELVNL
jgi:hypothetical protein